jgi:hypothetical protein
MTPYSGHVAVVIRDRIWESDRSEVKFRRQRIRAKAFKGHKPNYLAEVVSAARLLRVCPSEFIRGVGSQWQVRG